MYLVLLRMALQSCPFCGAQACGTNGTAAEAKEVDLVWLSFLKKYGFMEQQWNNTLSPSW